MHIIMLCESLTNVDDDNTVNVHVLRIQSGDSYIREGPHIFSEQSLAYTKSGPDPVMFCLQWQIL